MFAFDLYDTDASGRIETAEIENMLKEVYGREGYEKNQHAAKLMARINNQVCSKTDHCVTLEAFSQFSADNPAMLFPAFEMQRKIQKAVLGVSFWAAHLDRRLKLVDDGRSFISVKQLLKMRVNRQAFKEMVEQPLEEEAQRAQQFGYGGGGGGGGSGGSGRGGGGFGSGSSEAARLALDAAGTRATRGGGAAAFAAANAKAKLGARKRASQARMVTDIHQQQQQQQQQQHSQMKAGWERR